MNILFVCNIYHASPRVPSFIKYLSKNNKIYLIVPYILKKKSAFGPRINLEKYCEIYYLDKKELIKKTNNQFTKYVDKNPFISKITRNLYYLLRKTENEADIEFKEEIISLSEKIIDSKKIDIIFTTSSPTIYHEIGKYLKLKKSIKWVADLRDLWSLNHSHSFITRIKTIKKEKSTLKYADLITTVSLDWGHTLQKNYPSHKILVLHNGFDPDDFKKLKKKKSKFKTFTYAGNLYFGKQNPEILFKALSKLKKENKIGNSRFLFYIPKLYWLEYLIDKYDLKDIIQIKSVLPSSKVPGLLYNSDAIFLFNWEDKHQKGVIPLKFYEGLGSGKIIFAIGGFRGQEVDNIIKETNAGQYLINEKEIYIALSNFINNFKKDIRYNPVKYSYKTTCNKLNLELKKLMNNK